MKASGLGKAGGAAGSLEGPRWHQLFHKVTDLNKASANLFLDSHYWLSLAGVALLKNEKLLNPAGDTASLSSERGRGAQQLYFYE